MPRVSFHNIRHIAAAADSGDTTAWVNVDIAGDTERLTLTLFGPRSYCEVLADAINAAGASWAAQRVLNDRLSEAGIREMHDIREVV